MSKIIRARLSGSQNGVFTDPADENVFYIAQDYGVKSSLLIPSQSRYFIIPAEAIEILKESGAKVSEGEMYSRYRGIWKICPRCGEVDECVGVSLQNSDVHITHCMSYQDFAYGMASDRNVLRCLNVTHIRDKPMPVILSGLLDNPVVDSDDFKDFE